MSRKSRTAKDATERTKQRREMLHAFRKAHWQACQLGDVYLALLITRAIARVCKQ